MPRNYHAQTSFSSGEVSPLLHSRTDTEAAKSGSAIMRNMVPLSHGPAGRRNGTRSLWYNDPAIDGFTTTYARIMDFSISKSFGTFAVVMLMDDGTTKIAPYTTTGGVVDPESELVKNWSFNNGGDDWTDISIGSGVATFSSGRAFLTAASSTGQDDYTGPWDSDTGTGIPLTGQVVIGDLILFRISKTDSIAGSRGAELLDLKPDDTIHIDETAAPARFIDYQVTGLAIDGGSYVDVPVIITGSGSVIRNGFACTVDWTVFKTTGQASGIEQEITGTVLNNNLTLTITSVNDTGGASSVVSVGSAQGLADIYQASYIGDKHTAEFLNTGGTSVWLTVVTATDEPVKPIDAISMYDSTLTTPGQKDIIFDAPWTANDIDGLQYETPPEGNVLYITSHSTPLQALAYDPATDAWAFAAATITGAPVEWVAGNYPRAITFYQGRMWLGGSPLQRETFWASKSGTILDFTQGEAADDGLEFTMDEHGQIEWVVGAKNLIIGTASGEHIVESEAGVITPSDIQITQQSSYGSRQHQPEKIGQEVLYVSPDGRKLREIGYKWTDDGWISRDITFASEHITRNNHIRRIAFLQNPGNAVMCISLEGDMLVCNYEKTYSVIGWSRHDTAGRFVDVATLDINGTSVAGILAFRNINGSERLFVETYDASNFVHMDSYIHQDYPAVTVDLVGLEHLAGNTVDVLTDTGVHPPVEVRTDGTATLQWVTRDVLIGYNVHSHLRTLSPDVIGPEGSTHAFTKGWGPVYVRILNSGKPTINGQPPAERHPSTLMNEPEPGRTEDVKVSNLGYGTNIYIDIEQDLPISLTVACVFGELNKEVL